MAEFLLYDDAACLPLDPHLIEHIKSKDVNKYEPFENLDLMCFDFLDIADMTHL